MTRHNPRPDGSFRVAVVGGGLAGVAAATVLAERGLETHLYESGASLGGRVGAWREQHPDGTVYSMERGFHAFFRHYYNLRSLMRRVDPTLSKLMPLADYPLLGPEGRFESFSRLPRRAPLNLMAVAWRSSSMSLWDALRVNRQAARALLAFDLEETYAAYDEISAAAYLDSLEFPAQARQMLFDIFAHSFFNPQDELSAAELIMMFHYYFLANPEGLVFDVLTEPFDQALWAPMEAYLRRLGVRVHLGQRIHRVDPVDATSGLLGYALATEERHIGTFNAAILALPVAPLKSVTAASPRLGPPSFRSRVQHLEVTAPFAVWRLWLDRPARGGRFPFAGTTGIGCLDNISLYHLFESESAAWAAKTGGSVVELHAYALPEGVRKAELERDLLNGLHNFYPELRGARVMAERFVLRRDCPAFAPGSHRTRPGIYSGWENLLVAGDFVRLPFPSALMERATSSGMMAANHILKLRKREPEPIWSIANRGILARGGRQRQRPKEVVS